jgi:hypothetical protein
MKAFERTRTIRLSGKTDQRIEAVAAQHGRTASEIIRETLEREFAESTETAGQWILKGSSRRPDRKPDEQFAQAFNRRHR